MVLDGYIPHPYPRCDIPYAPHASDPRLGRPDRVVLRQRLRLKDLEDTKGAGKDSQSTMYAYIYIYLHFVYVCIYIYRHIHIYVCIYVYVYVSV